MNNINVTAIQDIPLGEGGSGNDIDQLGVGPYVEALEAFILSCGTPMTVAIQGDWGTGKTSMMRQIESGINTSAHTIWFNTWQYSQFSQADTLPLMFLTALANRLVTKGLSSALKESFGDVVKQMAPHLFRAGAKLAVNAMSGGVLGEIVNYVPGFKAGDDDEENENEKSSDLKMPKLNTTKEHKANNPAHLLEKLKESFAKACLEKCSEAEKSRIVIFIDDLDRIQPIRAVELLEILKMFLDVGNCVFVLALDYAVVKRGLGEKFGVSEKDLDGRSFFDKIIQLPFSMPTGSYKLEKYLSELLLRVGFTTHTKDIGKYLVLLQNSIGANPRSIKRLINVVTLMNIVFIKQKQASNATGEEIATIDDDEHREILLFAFVCLQTAYEPLYSHLRLNFSIETLSGMCDNMAYENVDSQLYKAASCLSGFPSNCDRVIEFMKAFYGAVDKNGDKEIDDSEMNAMRSMMHNLSITAVETQHVQFKYGDTVRDDIITSTCKNAMNLFELQSGFDVKNHDEYAKTDGPRSNRYFSFNDGTLCVYFYLSGQKTSKDSKLREHEVHVFIFLDEDSFLVGNRPSKEKFTQFCSSLDSIKSPEWEIHTDKKLFEAGIKLPLINQCPGGALSKLIACKLGEGYDLFRLISEAWEKGLPEK